MAKIKQDRNSNGRSRRKSSSKQNAPTTGNIRVIIRVRPFNKREKADNKRNVIKILDDHTVLFDPKEEGDPFFFHDVQQKYRDITKRVNKNLTCTFDRVFSDNADNRVVFESSTKTLIASLMQGYNCSVFVYGATGAGKTYTMFGKEEDPGITFLTLTELFKQKAELESEREFEIRATYIEVYNENLNDLLNPGASLSLREDANYGIVVSGLKMHYIEGQKQLFQLLDQGNGNRTQHPTDANAESSRSHAVLQVYVQVKYKDSKEMRVSKLSMIDLAGSERGAATGCAGNRFKEGTNINKSLLALGNCINSLAAGMKYVPYRNSKLTRLLKDSLGGNCQTVMIANVSPSSFNYEDTYNTLKYASRAKEIKSVKKKNVVTTESSLNHYMQLVEKLTKENLELKSQLAIAQKNCKCNFTSSKLEESQKAALQSEPNAILELNKNLNNSKHSQMLEHQLNEENRTSLNEVCCEKDKNLQENAVKRSSIEAAECGFSTRLAQEPESKTTNKHFSDVVVDDTFVVPSKETTKSHDQKVFVENEVSANTDASKRTMPCVKKPCVQESVIKRRKPFSDLKNYHLSVSEQSPVLTKAAFVKRLARNRHISPKIKGTSSKRNKENCKPYSRYHQTKSSGKNNF